jgi:hypothetical protein
MLSVSGEYFEQSGCVIRIVMSSMYELLREKNFNRKANLPRMGPGFVVHFGHLKRRHMRSPIVTSTE